MVEKGLFSVSESTLWIKSSKHRKSEIVGNNKFYAPSSSALTQLCHPKYEMVCLLVALFVRCNVSHNSWKLVIL